MTKFNFFIPILSLQAQKGRGNLIRMGSLRRSAPRDDTRMLA
jgi:hypothetical protein